VCVLPHEGQYLIFHSPQNGVGMMKTRDFEHFEPYGPLITLGQSQWPWAQGRLTAGFVLDLTKDPKWGKYIMFFHGSGPEDERICFDNHASIAWAWSEDLLTWHWEA